MTTLVVEDRQRAIEIKLRQAKRAYDFGQFERYDELLGEIDEIQADADAMYQVEYTPKAPGLVRFTSPHDTMAGAIREAKITRDSARGRYYRTIMVYRIDGEYSDRGVWEPVFVAKS